MAKFITIMSGKGGVGKTTSAINLGHALTKLGTSTVVMEGNLSSPNLSVHLGKTYFPITIHDVMHEGKDIADAIYEHHSGLRIIPADISINAMKLVNFEALRKHMHDLHLSADIVLIDGSPGLGRETTQLLNLTDEVLVVLNPNKSSLLDAKRLIDLTRKFKKQIAGVILTKYKKRGYRLSKEEIERYLDLPVLATIPEDKRFEKSAHNKAPYVHLYPRSKSTRAYKELAARLVGKSLF